MDDDVLIKVDHVSKKFCRSLKRSLWYGVQDMASEVLGRNRDGAPLRSDEFWAVNDVSFELRRGECLGLIGHNGAGKTTLLKILNGLLKPDHGQITMRGRVQALIALGAGFNPILTGRENIYVNASVLGLSKREINDKLDEIIDFAGVREFIDAPVQTYSSGMTVRLGFAVATALDPDVLLLDEVLAVGDASFRHKCYSRIAKLLSRAAVIFVSHGMDYVAQTCNRVVLMHRGDARHFDEPTAGIAAYMQDSRAAENGQGGEPSVMEVYAPIRSADVRILESPITYGGRLEVEVEIVADAAVNNAMFAFSAVNEAQQMVFCWHSTRFKRTLNIRRGRQKLRLSISPLLLHDGTYQWNLCVAAPESIEHLVWYLRAGKFEVASSFRPVGNIPYLAQAETCELQMLELEEAFSAARR